MDPFLIQRPLGSFQFVIHSHHAIDSCRSIYHACAEGQPFLSILHGSFLLCMVTHGSNKMTKIPSMFPIPRALYSVYQQLALLSIEPPSLLFSTLYLQPIHSLNHSILLFHSTHSTHSTPAFSISLCFDMVPYISGLSYHRGVSAVNRATQTGYVSRSGSTLIVAVLHRLAVLLT